MRLHAAMKAVQLSSYPRNGIGISARLLAVDAGDARGKLANGTVIGTPDGSFGSLSSVSFA